MHIVDSQLHLWAANTPQRPWPPGRERDAQRPVSDHEGDPAVRDGSGRGEPGGARAALLGGRPQRSGAGGGAPVSGSVRRDGSPRAAGSGISRDLLAGWKKQPGMLGMRFTFHKPHYRQFLTDGTADWLWPAAAQHGIPLMVLVPGSLEAIGRIAARHPGLKLVIDHAGLQLHAKAPEVLEDLPAVCALAKHPNVAVEGFGSVGLVGTALSVPRCARGSAQAVRRVRPAPHVLGHGPHPHAVHVSRMHRPVHRQSSAG